LRYYRFITKSTEIILLENSIISIALLTTVVCVVDDAPVPQKRKQKGIDNLRTLQQDTLTAINSLVAIQGELLQIKKAKLEMKKEAMEMKRAKLFAKGMWKDEDGNWMCVIKTSTEE